MSAPTALPKAVQKQVAIANQLVKEVYTDPKEKEGEAAAPVAETKPDIKPDSKPEAKAETPPAAKSAKEKEPAKKADTPPAVDLKDFEHMYQVLKGKYDAEVPRLHADNRDLRQQVNNLEAKMAAYISTQQAPQKAKGDSTTQKKGGPTKEQIEEFGPDLYEFIQSTARELADEQIRAMQAKMDERLGRVEQTTSHVVKSVTKSAREKLYERLGEAVPNWEQQNSDPAFLKWLGESDLFSGKERGELLSEAYQRNDAERVVAFFRSFLKENTADDHSPSSEAASEEVTPSEEPQTKLDELVAPGTPKTGPADAQDGSGKRVYTQADVTNLYRRKSTYIRKGKPLPKELQNMEADILRAQKEGRLRL